MAELKAVSEIYKISQNVSDVYSMLSNIQDMELLIRSNMNNDLVKEKLKEASKGDTNIADMIESIETSEDSIILSVKNFGPIEIVMDEKQENKLIKFVTAKNSSIPFPFRLFIQLIDKGAYDTRLRVTCIVELNMMMKAMLKGKLNKGIDTFASYLSQMPYSQLRSQIDYLKSSQANSSENNNSAVSDSGNMDITDAEIIE
ncbi:MAG: hypothetical protein N4A49_05115 [Marinifilaceae bacterium]|jgi:hypothetical protein|nr:hypothetical protein [Marinifilaceae bacterium]